MEHAAATTEYTSLLFALPFEWKLHLISESSCHSILSVINLIYASFGELMSFHSNL
jgi:hypothetical protein